MPRIPLPVIGLEQHVPLLSVDVRWNRARVMTGECHDQSFCPRGLEVARSDTAVVAVGAKAFSEGKAETDHHCGQGAL